MFLDQLWNCCHLAFHCRVWSSQSRHFFLKFTPRVVQLLTFMVTNILPRNMIASFPSFTMCVNDRTLMLESFVKRGHSFLFSP
ncbi:hypothetical protein Pelo_2961 [Pelomyxa schiedti]|nr:hypothetical protein Pelo_2961 [Pelomyxa schiedti]